MNRSIAIVLLSTLAMACETGKISSANTENSENNEKRPITLVIHGGAGTIKRENMTPEREKAYRDALALALNSGYAILESGGSGIDAVITSISVLEDSPLFNAGERGSLHLLRQERTR